MSPYEIKKPWMDEALFISGQLSLEREIEQEKLLYDKNGASIYFNAWLEAESSPNALGN